MIQISEYIFLDQYIHDLDIPTKYLPSPYKDTPYLIIKDFLKPHELPLFVDSLYKDDDGEVAKVKAELISGVINPKVIKKYRDTNVYVLEENLNLLYQSRFEEYQAEIEEYFKLAITLSTEVQALEYKKGGFYIQHADDSNALIDSTQNIVGYVPVAPERKLTSVLFTTSNSEASKNRYEFEGGELIFNF